jgi:prophage regulatory protein
MERFLKVTEVMSRVGLSRSAIYRMMDHGDFPTQIKLTDRSAAWVESEVDAWIARRIEEARA